MAEKKQKKSRFTVSTRRKIFVYIVLGLGAFISLIPFVWMISTSLMSLGEALGTEFFPSELHFENYVEAWRKADFSEYFLNSILITVITLSGQVTFSILAAYAFARIDFPGRDLIFSVLLSTMMIPAMNMVTTGQRWSKPMAGSRICPI